MSPPSSCSNQASSASQSPGGLWLVNITDFLALRNQSILVALEGGPGLFHFIKSPPMDEIPTYAEIFLSLQHPEGI